MLFSSSSLSLHVLVFFSCISSTLSSPHSNSHGNATHPIVHLDYVSLQGASSAQYNLTYFRRIPFAASTAGKNRFRAPQPPEPITNGTYDTDRAFDMCPQRTVNGSEDCLYLGLYSRPWTKKQPLRPVLLAFYGGGFIRGSATFSIPPSGYPLLNVSDSNDFVVVYSNYRTNVFGFLPGSKIAAHPGVDLNPGLLDQQAALIWIQKYITRFGGDPRNVTIWGQSAGGGSVVAQTIATGNRDKRLFTKALSSSPFWPKTPRYDAPESEAIYTQTLHDVGCAGATDEIACLQHADVQALRDSALRLSTSRQYTTSSFTFGPVLDTAFLTRPLSAVIRARSLNAALALSSYNLHEGEDFVPPGLQFLNATNTTSPDGFNASSASFDAWLAGFLPDLTSADLDVATRLYPPPTDMTTNTTPSPLASYNSTFARAGLLYRDLVLACPAYWVARTAPRRPGSLLFYTIPPARHASDVQYWNTVGAVQRTDRRTYDGYVGAMASFVHTGDPNAHKLTGDADARVPDVSEGKQFLISAEGLGQAEVGALEGRCAFWLGVAERVPV